jgi:photosystem II stability/assembly factor-like uncharacterized protein
MKGPIDAREEKKTVRQKSSEIARARYPCGKALARIAYFETQRGLAQTAMAGRRVASAAAKTPRVSRKPKGRSRVTSGASEYAKANKVKSRLIPKFAASSHLPVWRPLGPNFIPKGQTYGKGGNNKPPVSGRCVGIVISPTNPKHLVLCSGGGGLWGTLDQGTTWQPLTDQQPTLSMGAIAAAPNSPNIVYAGTGEGDNLSLLGVGLLRSSDGGQSWQHVQSNDLTGTGIYDIAVDPEDALHVWVGTMEKLLSSTNGGTTWQTVQPATTWDISINPANPQEIFAATAAGLVRSLNGGSTWVKVSLSGVTSTTEFERMEVCHAPSNPAVVYVAAVFNDRPALWRRASNSGAFSMQQAPAMKFDEDIRQAWYDFCFAVSPVDPDLVYWGAVYLYKGKRTSSSWKWQDISARNTGDSIHGDQHHLAFDPSDPNVLYACNDGGVFRSPNGGTNWQSLNPGLGISEFEFIVQLESQDDWLIGGTQDNGTLGNALNSTWNQVALGDGGDCGADDDQKLCYHSYYDMWIERAPALGQNAFKWKDVSPPFPENYDALFYPPMDVSGNIISKAGVTLWVSENRGDDWEELDFGGGGEKASAVVIVSPTTIFVGTEAGKILRIKRAANGWTEATVTALTSPRDGFISDIVVPGTPSKVIWASSSAFGGGHVFRSMNGGKTWADRGGNLPDIPVNAIVVDPKDRQHVFAATDHGVYRTLNSGAKWTDFSNGLPNMVVGDMILHERRRLLRVGTRNRGAWEVKI